MRRHSAGCDQLGKSEFRLRSEYSGSKRTGTGVRECSFDEGVRDQQGVTEQAAVNSALGQNMQGPNVQGLG